MRILAVDDDPMILELLKEALPGLGFPHIVVASSAFEAMDLIRTSPAPFECCLFDIQMPQMTGVALCEWLRGQPGYARVPVLMITAMSERSYIDQSFAAGATDYVSKPFDPMALSTRMKNAEKMNRDRNKAAPAIEALQNTHPLSAPLIEDLNRIEAFEFSAAFNIVDVPSVIDFGALENYLLQLGRGGMIASACFAFQIVEARHLYASMTPEEYFYTITDLAEVIAEALTYHETFVSHAGGGAIVCVSHGPLLPDEDELMTHIRISIESLDLRYDNGLPIQLSLRASPRLRLGLRSGRSAIDQLYRAVALCSQSEQARLSQSAASRFTLKHLLSNAFDWAR